MHILLAILRLLLLVAGSAAKTDLQILLDIKQTFTTSTNLDDSWLPTNAPCNFSGVACDNTTGSVSSINLSGRSISGYFPFSALCLLPSLTYLSLGNNQLSGPVTAIRNCTALRHLDIASNSFSGPVPDLSTLTHLQVLNLSGNSFTGNFPYASLSRLTALTVLAIGDNLFAPSPFPAPVLNLTSLYRLYLSVSNIHGEIPPAIGGLTSLTELQLADNFLTGEIPQEITKLTGLGMLELYNNSLTGKFPPGFGNLTNLWSLDASMNYLEGDLYELRLMRNLVSLQLFYNNFTGEVPPEFGDFKYLVNLSLYSNSLSGELPEKLGSWAEFNFIDVSTNYFTGRIPPDMCRMGAMQKLLVLQNNFSGEIPAAYGNCSTLLRFRVSNNSLSGAVPEGIWSLPRVNVIDLGANQLEGPVAAGIGRAKALNELSIADNQFSGELPEEIAGADSLVKIDAGSNKFSGRIPAGIGGLVKLTSLVLEDNEFSGNIPDSLGSCAALSVLSLAGNSLTGPIPASLGKLQRLNSLDLSDNQLSGEIPVSLSSLKLSTLRLSDNRLTGAVPPALAIGAYSDSFIRNPGLCGINIWYLRRCSTADRRSSGRLRKLLTVFFIIAAVLLAALGAIAVIKRRRRYSDDTDRQLPIRQESWDLKSFRVLTFDEQEVIDAVRHENLIGKGGSGNVYRVELGSGKVVAVKHIWNTPDGAAAAACAGDGGRMLARRGSTREFEAEVGTLSAIRHVNVVKLYCSITSEDSSLLVYEHLPNGSLWDRLHGPEGVKLGLEWEARYRIAAGSARGLEYLHHGWDRPIVHRDVKSSNILLDEGFQPRIADFGLARILNGGVSGKDEWSHVVAGTHGYIAPEYGYTWRVDEKSDVYSFGVVLMELVTGRRPIEAAFGESKDIVGWVSERLRSEEGATMLVDTRIRGAEREEALKLLKIAMLCVARQPILRPSMRSVAKMLEEAGGDTVVGCGGNQVVQNDIYNMEDSKSPEKEGSSPDR